LNKWLDYKERKLKLQKYEIDINTEVTDNIEQRLDTIIESCFQEYSLLNLVYKSDWYISESEEIQIQKDIAHLVAERISPVMMQHLLLYYNEGAIMEVITKRVYFRVVNFVIEHNRGTGI
jgi:hypothetical protein